MERSSCAAFVPLRLGCGGLNDPQAVLLGSGDGFWRGDGRNLHFRGGCDGRDGAARQLPIALPKVLAVKARDVHPLIYAIGVLFVLCYALL